MRRNGDSRVPMVLEGVRKPRQMEAIQNAIGHRYVRHIHLRVDKETQKRRYEEAQREKDSLLQFERAIDDASEKLMNQLERRGRRGY